MRLAARARVACSHNMPPAIAMWAHFQSDVRCAGALNLFGGVLIQKKRAEEALEASNMVYTIVRPGGMERPQDDYKATHNVTLQPRDSLFGGQVSRLQVAEVVAAALGSQELAENKASHVPLNQHITPPCIAASAPVDF